VNEQTPFNAPKHNDLRHISSIDNRGHFNRKKIAIVRLAGSAQGKIHDARASYDEKDTVQTKLSQCTAHNCQNVMFFAGNLSSTRGNWRLCVQTASKPPFWIFYLNETARQTASIFFGPETKDRNKMNKTVRTP
jgi:hypothetical protein